MTSSRGASRRNRSTPSRRCRSGTRHHRRCPLPLTRHRGIRRGREPAGHSRATSRSYPRIGLPLRRARPEPTALTGGDMASRVIPTFETWVRTVPPPLPLGVATPRSRAGRLLWCPAWSNREERRPWVTHWCSHRGQGGLVRDRAHPYHPLHRRAARRFVGGCGCTGGGPAGTFTPAGSLVEARFGHTATLLPDGRVLVVGGYAYGALASAEVWDPVTATFSPAGSLAEGRTVPHRHAPA